MGTKINYDDRLDPDALLKSIKKLEEENKSGKLKIFFGMSAGVGKTYAMLEDAQQRYKEGVDIVIGLINTHGRKETEMLTTNLPAIPEKVVDYKGRPFKELDIDAILKKHPSIVIVDELAHTNVPGSRHHKRWQDVIELLDAGIDVYSTLNVQHIESRKDVVEEITGIIIRETVPDLVLERASQIELVDITPNELLRRLKEGKVYLGPQSEIAAKNFFQIDRLTALREIALRLTAEKVDHELHGLLPSNETSARWKPSEKLMVAVSHSPHSQSLIRTCRRYAFTFDAPWIAIHVDNGKRLSTKDKEQLFKNLALARELGAEVISIVDSDIGQALQRTAKHKQVTQIILGRPEKRFFRNLFGTTSLIDALKHEHSEIDIHIIRKDASIPVPQSRFPRFEFTSPSRDYWWTAIFMLAVALICNFFTAYLTHQLIGFIFLISILLDSFFVSSGPLILAAALASIIWGFTFIPSDIRVGQVEIGLVTSFFAAAAVVGILSEKVKERERLLRIREEKTQALYEIVREIAKAPNVTELFNAICAKLDSLLAGKSEILRKINETQLAFNDKSELIQDEKEKAVATWSLDHGTEAGLSTATLASAANLYIPLRGYTETVGVLVFRPDDAQPVLPEELNLLQTICQQLAVYLERIESEERNRRIEYAQQVEKIQHAILNSISMELYNPVHSIKGAAQELIASDPKKNEPLNQRRIQQIEDSSNNLSRIVDNVLAISKLNSGFFKINKELHQINDLISACLNNMKKNLENHNVEQQVAENIPQILFDFYLMELLLCNLLINASEYSPPGKTIQVGARMIANYVMLFVADEGNGIPEDHIPLVFQKFYRLPGTKPAGIGLGLSLVKTIAEMHQAKLEVRNRPEGGVEFMIYLPK
jgi:two-component system, OmpR family, sensor histidine kinase KdpD